mmetsp:Transcript_27601/g.40759  ORF Transcript_27601/g.40759 Transcript_27601/m.40759 type:complete len:410 (-) Transcript_27601:248-1477(-)
MPLTSPSTSETAQILNDIEHFNYGTIASQENEDGPTNTNDVRPYAEENDEVSDTVPDVNDNNESRGTMVEILTRRLRCLFSTITWPIVPLGTLVSLCLLWVLYCAFLVDAKASCSHPLHAYALASLCFLLYAPYHAQIRSYIFRYSRERDGPIRPTRVRLYDQLFHTLCILYVYGGVTVLQSCQQDFGDGATATISVTVKNATSHTINTCEATCPHLYAATNIYVAMLELFTLSLILPLLFLPCIYLWILRRASTAAESFFREGEDLFGRGSGGSRGRTSVEELMHQLEIVKLVNIDQDDNKVFLRSITDGKVETKETIVKDCCICMSDFNIADNNDVEMGAEEDEDPIVQTRCGHIFHAKCLKSWVGGRWNVESSENRRAQRTCCPLCRKDLRPSRSEPTISTNLQSI